MRKVYDIIVTGGGAAGMMAALFSARAGANVLLLERNEKLGKKLYITGKGRCNLTNMKEPEAFMKHIVRNPRFMYAALAKLNNVQLMDLIESLGVPLKQERGERVYPQSDRASDITKALEGELNRLRVKIELNTRVKSVWIEDGQASGVMLEDGRIIESGRVILATGGLSYPATGSTGDGHRMALEAGHKLTPTLPALTAIETLERWPQALMGLSLKNVNLSAVEGKKTIYSEQGELLFTHFGISGPLALTMSSFLHNPCEGTRIFIDLKPALDGQTLDQRLLREFKSMPNKQLISAMDTLEPHNLALALLELAQLSPTQPINSVTEPQRRRIAELLKRVPLTVKRLRGFDEAVITRGGVDVKSINPSTMESKLVSGLYFAGELIDIDALTGGFNLQLAFSTGALAGLSAAKKRATE